MPQGKSSQASGEPNPPNPSGHPPSEDDSPTSPRASGAASVADFLSDSGPEFTPGEEAPPQPEPEAPAEPEFEPVIEWNPEVIEHLLKMKGQALHGAFGVAEADWLYTSADLEAIAPPLTRIANRYDAVRRLAKHADPLAVLVGLSGYSRRSLRERREVLEEEEAEEEAAGGADTGAPEQPGAEVPGVRREPAEQPKPKRKRKRRRGDEPPDPEQIDWERPSG